MLNESAINMDEDADNGQLSPGAQQIKQLYEKYMKK
jgi:hypothetical protein